MTRADVMRSMSVSRIGAVPPALSRESPIIGEFDSLNHPSKFLPSFTSPSASRLPKTQSRRSPSARFSGRREIQRISLFFCH
jgi:hypothetical protein